MTHTFLYSETKYPHTENGLTTTNITIHTYTHGRISKTESTGQPDTLYAYDELGNRIASCVDADDDGTWDYSGPDRISSNSTAIVQYSGEWVRETKSYIYAQDSSDTATLVSTRREWMPVSLGTAAPSPYSGVLTAKSSTTDIHGNTTWQYTYTDAANAVRVGLVSTPDSTTDAVTKTVNGLVTEQTSQTGVTTTYTYDALGRRTGSETDSSGGSRTTGTTINYNSKGQVAWTMDAASNTTYYAYSPDTGRRVAVTNAVNDVTYTDYDPQGNVVAIWGATYPVGYEYSTAR